MLTRRCRLRRIPKFSQCENQNTYFSLYSTTAKQKEGEEEDQQQKSNNKNVYGLYREEGWKK